MLHESLFPVNLETRPLSVPCATTALILHNACPIRPKVLCCVTFSLGHPPPSHASLLLHLQVKVTLSAK